MSTLVKPNLEQNKESYRPKDKPIILSMAEEMKERNVINEIIVERVNEFCSIVERDRMHIVGIQVQMNTYSSFNAVTIVKKLIKEGTCALLEELIHPKNKGQYIAAVSEVKTGIEYTYVIGIEVEDFNNLPNYLPPNTVTLRCPAARYGKVVRNPADPENRHTDPKQAICYLSSSEFRLNTGWVYDINSIPFRVFDADSELISAYEPVKKPANEEQRFEQVGCEVVMLPELKVIGCTGADDSCMWNLFAIENTIDWKAAGCLSEYQYHSFTTRDWDGNNISIFGHLVSDFENTPDNLVKAVMPSGLWVRFYQKQINNDDPSIFFEGAKDILFFQKNPDYEEDYSNRSMLYVAQYEQGACVYFPIREVTEEYL
ncbi:MAG TPA: hypothetical protein VHQ24_15550 [Lachnospiraceae bacterium]|nr:hypothetical protein [Lachnospiraceae bacterium]